MENAILHALREQKEMNLPGGLYHKTQIVLAYNTNRIEGSQLTEEQTRSIFETHMVFADWEKPIRTDDIIETQNHFHLFDYMLDHADERLSADMIKKFHDLLKRGTSDVQKSWFRVGAYKSLPNEVGGQDTAAPDQVAEFMQQLLSSYAEKTNVSMADMIDFHAKFEKIHPFQDGNGRVGRIIMFKECLKNNITPFIIDAKDQSYYYRGLREYQAGREKGYLIDTCLSAQDQFTLICNKLLR